jgi:outer membrane protein insertion porin family
MPCWVRTVFISVLLLGLVAVAADRSALAASGSDSAIAVAGNRHIGADMIRSHFHPGPDGRFNTAALDAGLKSLYATGLFQDVIITHNGDGATVKVVENPTIQRIAFEGNKKIKDADLTKIIQSVAGGPLSRAFVQDDVERILALYRQRGYFEARIDPKTISAKNERANLVFEVKEGNKLAVRQIQFVGNNAFAQNKLDGIIRTGKTNFLSFLLDNDIYDADRVENDRDLLRHFYLVHGYADVRVRESASYEAGKKGVVLTYTIDEGPQYRLGSVDIESGLKGLDAAALRSSLHTPAGAIYDTDAVDKTVDDLVMKLAKSGQPFATVVARKVRVPPPATQKGGAGVINVVYAVEEGRRLYVERIDIHGNLKTRDDVIRREFDIAEGDAYNRALVARGERHLKQLGYFKTVKISTQKGSAPDRIVLDVAVQEQGTGDFSIAGGYSTSEGMLAQVSIGDKNFMGTGDIAKASVTYGQYARGFDLAFTDPAFLNQRLSLGVDLFGKETFANTNQSYNSTVYGAKFAAGTPLNDQLGLTWTYSIYNQGVSLDPANGIASLPIQQAALAGPMWVSSIGNGVTYSTLDDIKNPTTGIRAQFNNEVAGLGGAAKFARNTEDVRYYHPIAGDVVGMVRAQGGYVTPWGGQQLPLLDNFFGGPQLVRGFAPNGFGPRDLTPGTAMDNVGGNVYWTTSAELQAPMPLVSSDAKLKVALFSDTGSLWATSASGVSKLTSSLSPSQQIANSRAIRSSVGAVLVWDSMFGPIRVDYAYPIAKQSFDVTQRLQFSAGGF